MAEPIRLNGLVIRETVIGESDKLLTVLTKEKGKIPVVCKGVRSIKSRRFASSQLFCYDELTLSEKGDRYYLSEACLIENFFSLRSDIESFSLAQYFAELLSEVTVENVDQSEFLSLALNSLYVLMPERADKAKPKKLIKTVFELRLASALGIFPDVTSCEKCGKASDGYYLDLAGGTSVCPECLQKLSEAVPTELFSELTRTKVFVGQSELHAMEEIVSANPKRIFSFNSDEKLLASLADVSEKYLISQLGRNFDSLKFFKSLESI